MYGSAYIFSKPFFTGWVTVGIIWLFCSAFCVGVWPVVESRGTIVHTVKSMILDVQGKYHPKKWHEQQEDGVLEGESGEGSHEGSMKGGSTGEKAPAVEPTKAG